MATKRDIVGLGASAGGLAVLTRIFEELPSDFPAAVFVVQHLDPHAPGLLPEILDRAGDFPVKQAENGEPVTSGRAYVAPPDRHLLTDGEKVILSRGARENRTRPAIDPLFRSLALAWGPRVTGVILSGKQDDGASGLKAVQMCGGTAVIQDPEEASYAEMPQSALRELEKVDHRVASDEIAALLAKLVREDAGPAPEPPGALRAEVEMTLREDLSADRMESIGQVGAFSCPECGGPLWEIGYDGVRRFRCHTGHAFTSRSLVDEFSQSTERSLWAAVRAMEERARMLERLAAGSGGSKESKRYEEDARDARRHVEELRKLLVGPDPV